ncbi:hypothetical protein HPB52_002480 [Rhipicephalus sanguineus]|uniref:Endonuclease/exonuclease/phosphatase domain-containing protein n=1 Tax=Rhipicephalus sanguineus TaxID=34632 RepID=A0A9D4PG42_RHISA|nr:hypothetical protein HPB52_002480 [Rhipicephalus sanguineus]
MQTSLCTAPPTPEDSRTGESLLVRATQCNGTRNCAATEVAPSSRQDDFSFPIPCYDSVQYSFSAHPLSMVLPWRATSAPLAAGSLLEAQKTNHVPPSPAEHASTEALDRLSTLLSSTASASDMDTHPADGCHEALNSLRTHLAAFPSVKSLQSLQETVDTLHAFMLESVRAKPTFRTRASSTAPAARPSQSQAEETAAIFSYTSNNLTVRVHLTASCSSKLTPLFACRATLPTIKWPSIPHSIPSRPSSPGGRSRSIWSFTLTCAVRAAKSPFLVLGDFNVKHLDWGYPKTDGPGTRLWQLAHDLRLTLLTNPTQPTRVGNSVCRDTTPDLSYCRYVRMHAGPTHINLWAATTMSSPCKSARPRASRHSATPDIEDLSQWTDQLPADLDSVTASIPTTANHLAIDSRLAHLQAAHTNLTNRWNKQRHNPLDREIETHTTTLAHQQWEQLCSGLSNHLGCKPSWHLLRHLLDPTSTKSVIRQQLQRVIQAYPGDTSSLMADLSAKYLQLLPSHGLSHLSRPIPGPPTPI